jgi:hypothetical protein
MYLGLQAKRSSARLNEGPPAFLPFCTFHPVFVQLEKLVVRGLDEFREVCLDVLVDLVVNSVKTVQRQP